MARRPSRRAFVPRLGEVEPRLLLSTLHVDTRVPVADTTAYPYSGIVNIVAVFPHGYGRGTGAMTDATHVLTVAHNIYNKSKGGWAEAVEVIPAQAGANRPLGTYAAVRETIYTNYAEQEFRGPAGFGFDLAQLRLATPTVPGVGALGVQVQPDAYFRGAAVITSGYPGDKPSAKAPDRGQVMYTGEGETTGAGPRLVHFNIATASGQSGSPIYRTDATGTYIEAVLCSGRPAKVTVSYDNDAVRLTSTVVADLRNWGVVDSVADPSVVFAGAELPHDPATFVVSTAFTPQGLMHVLPG